MDNNLIRKFFDSKSAKYCQKINDETAKDLNIDELFDSIDNTQTPIGQQYLYSTLRTIDFEKNPIEENETWIESYSNNITLKKRVAKVLAKLNKRDSYDIYSLINEDYTPFSKNKVLLFYCLQLIPAIFVVSLFFVKSWILIIGLLVFFLINLFIHYYSKSKLFSYSGSIPMLRQLIKTGITLSKDTEINTNLVTSVKIEDAIKSTKPIYKSLSSYRLFARLESDNAMIAWALTELVRVFFLSEVINLHNIFKKIKQSREGLLSMFEYVGLIETLSSISIMRQSCRYYCLPTFNKEIVEIDIQDIYHPLIEDCVSNSLSLSKDSFLILGSNMSGKTTFIRTVGTNILLAQTINTCFAKKMTLNKQNVYSIIAVNDSLMRGHSYYLSEVLKIKDLIYNTQEGSNLILLDELFKGTNTKERVAAAKAVLKYLSKNKNNRILVATHDFELIELLGNTYTSIFFEEKITEDKLFFDYKVSFKSTGKTNAIRILDLYDFPKEIIDDALLSISNE